MNEAESNFDRWFTKPLQALNDDGHAAFAVLMIAFPLLERYLREKSGVHEAYLNDAFYDEFHQIFGSPSRVHVPHLWHSYRNGLLHQATFSKKSRNGTVMPSSFITSKIDLIEFDAENDAFYVNPKTFSEKTIAEIRNNFDVFEGASSTNHPLPVVRENAESINTGEGPPPSGTP